MPAVVLDTDIGTDVDDAIALALLAGTPGVELASVTTVGGKTGIRAALARRLLAQSGHGDVPVAAGYGIPLGSDRFSVMIADGLWLGHEGRGVLTDQELQAAEACTDPAAAIRQLTCALTAASRPAILLTIGPLTNLAVALTEQPGLKRHIGLHVAMGGMVEESPVGASPASPMLEYNLNADREACAVVLEAGLNTILVPAGLTVRAEVKSGNLGRLRAGRHPVLRDIVTMIEIWSPVYRQLLRRLAADHDVPADLACHLHDPIAVLAAVEPELFRIEPMRIDLAEEAGMLTTRRSASGAYAVQVATDADMPRLCQRVIDQLAEFDDELEQR